MSRFVGQEWENALREATRRVNRVPGRIALGALLLIATTVAAWAHAGGSTGYASITVSRDTVRYTLDPARPPLCRRTWPRRSGSRRRAARRSARSCSTWSGARIVLHADGTRCEPGPGQLLPSAFDAPSFTMSVDFACGSAVRDLAVQDDIFDVLGPDHHTLAKLETPSGTQQFAFAPDGARRRGSVSATRARRARATGSFFVLGVEHILTGYDHLLFLLCLLLPGGGLLSLAKIITAFTIAHSVTLTLAVLQVVTLPDRLIEAVIALSIAFVVAPRISCARPDGLAAMARELRLRPRARLRLFLRAARARPPRPGPAPLALRLQRWASRSGRPWSSWPACPCCSSSAGHGGRAAPSRAPRW